MLFQTTRRLLVGTYVALFSNIGMALRICVGWFLIRIILYFALGVGSIDYYRIGIDESFRLSGKELFSIFLFGIIPFLYYPAIAVAWIRGLVLAEMPRAIHLRFGFREIKFAGLTLLLSLFFGVLSSLLISVLIFLPVFLLQMVFGQVSIFIVILLLVPLFFMFLLFVLSPVASLSLVLSAVACDERLSLGKAFDTGRSLGVPMVLAGVTATLPVMALAGLIGFLFGFPVAGYYPGGVLGLVVFEALSLVGLILGSGILAGAYYILRQRQLPSGGGPQVPQG